MKLRAWRSLESSDPCHGSDHGFKSRRPRSMVLGDKSLISGVGLATVFAFLGVGVMLFKVDPFQASVLTKIIFFSAAFWGVFSLIIFLVQRKNFAGSFWIGFLVASVLFSWLILRIRN